MRFMMLLPAPVEALEKCAIPDKELVLAMHKYNDQLKKAGALLSAEGLHPTSKGTRLRISGGKPVITDGPFAEAKEVIAGFWIIQANSKEEALEWAKRCPLPEHGLIEIRQIFENHDFPPELQTKHHNAGA
jgi:hypothetical protein